MSCIAYTDKRHYYGPSRKTLVVGAPILMPELVGNTTCHPSTWNATETWDNGTKTEENNGNTGANADPNAHECIDEHWMKSEVRRSDDARIHDIVSQIFLTCTFTKDVWCPLNQLIDTDSFHIERHALRISGFEVSIWLFCQDDDNGAPRRGH